jgi:hypothetical protein
MIETKVLKQLIRDIIQPGRDLGHSDRKNHKSEANGEENISNETPSVENTESNTAATTEEPMVKTSNTVTSQLRDDAEKPCEDCQ